MFKISIALLLLTNLYQAFADVNPSTSGYCYSDTQTAAQYDWNITVTDVLEIEEELDQGIFKLTTNITLDDQHYDVQFFEEAGPDGCTVPASPFFPITFVTAENTNMVSGGTNFATLVFEYNQTMVQESSIWTANKTGGNAYFCLKISNYLDVGGDPFGLAVNFIEVNYQIQVDSLTDFDTSISIFRKEVFDGGIEFIDYEEDIVAYACDDTYAPVTLTYQQGDAVCICVETVDGSAFEVHSIKELTVSQINDTDSGLFVDYDYVENFIDSPLSLSTCMDSNTTDAVCKTKLQLIAGFYIEDQIAASASTLDINGVVKLDYLGRRLSVDVPITAKLNKEVDASASRKLAENGGTGFETKINIEATNEDGMSSGSSTPAFATLGAVAAAAGIFAMV